MADEPIRGMRSGREQARRDRLARKLRESRRATRERKPTVPTTPASPPPSGPRRPSWVGKQFGKYTEGVKDRFSGEGGSIATGLPILAILAGILLLTLFVFKGKWFGWVAFGLVMLIFWKKIPQIWRTLAILVGCMIFFKGQFFVWMFWVAFALAVLELIFRLLMQVLPESVIKLIRGIIYLVLIGAIIWFLFNFFQTGGGTILGVEMENTGAYKTLEWVKNGAWTLFNKPGELFTYYSTWDQPEVAEENVKRGIEFYDIDTRRDYFKEGDPITLYFTSSVSALVDSDTVVTFGCEIDLKDNKTQAGTIVLSGLEGNEFTVFSGNDEDIDGTCTIPGVSLEEGKKSTKKGEEGVSIYAVNINGIYQNFESKSALKIYTIPSENLRDVDYSFYPELDKNHRAKTQCIRGCGLTKFSLKTAKQPQTNVGSYSLGIGIRKDIDWLGDLFKIKRIEVNVPSNFELLTCEDFGGDNVLEEGEPGLEALNERIKKDYGTPSDYSIYCDYKIVRPKVNPGEFDEIQVSVTYDYRVDIKKTVNVVGLRSAYPDQMVYGEEEEDDGYEEVGGVYSYTE